MTRSDLTTVAKLLLLLLAILGFMGLMELFSRHTLTLVIGAVWIVLGTKDLIRREISIYARGGRHLGTFVGHQAVLFCLLIILIGSGFLWSGAHGLWPTHVPANALLTWLSEKH